MLRLSLRPRLSIIGNIHMYMQWKVLSTPCNIETSTSARYMRICTYMYVTRVAIQHLGENSGMLKVVCNSPGDIVVC